ncbi:hypothetical protein [Virgibacillus sp. DJP39]|uniref:hypothetical protein n=1 Tax=Virgibacillus sp. DJP39 TaxID=3409790 RepID=UPI003BB5FC99
MKKKKTNPYHRQLKNVLVVEGMYSTHTFFTLGKKLFIYSSNIEKVYEIVDINTNQQQFREDLSSPMALEVIQLKTQNRLKDFQQFFLPSMKEIHEDFWDEISREQRETLSDIEKKMLDIANKSENDFLEILNKNPEEQALTYNYFGELVAYEENDRQWIDYYMSQGDFDAAFSIHLAYVKE